MLFILELFSFSHFMFSCSFDLHFHVQPEKVAFELKAGQSKPIYNAFKAIKESPEWNSLSDARKRIVEGTFFLNFFFCCKDSNFTNGFFYFFGHTCYNRQFFGNLSLDLLDSLY